MNALSQDFDLVVQHEITGISMSYAANPCSSDRMGSYNVDWLIFLNKVRLNITPSLVHLDPGSSQHFSINVGKPSSVKWMINDRIGGSRKVGTIDRKGKYKAPVNPEQVEFCIQPKIGRNHPLYAWATVIIGEQSPEYSFVGCWNKKGEHSNETSGELRQAHAICFEPTGNLLICDSFLSRVYRYTPQGDYLGEIGLGPGKEPGTFRGPRNMAVAESGEIYVADGTSHCIQVFSPKGQFLRKWGKKGSGQGELRRPHAIALGPEGTVAVADVDNERVVIYNSIGEHLRHWGQRGSNNGEFQAPHGLAIDPNGDLIVVEYDGRCQKFTMEGDFLYSFANQSIDGERMHGDYLYHDMTSDQWGNVYLMARNTRKHRINTIDKYNNSGDFITRFKLPSQIERKLGAKGAAVTQSGRIFVADSQRRFAGISIFEPQTPKPHLNKNGQ